MNKRQIKKLEKKQLNKAIEVLRNVVIPTKAFLKSNHEPYSYFLNTYKELIKQLDNQPKPQAIFVPENLYTTLKELDAYKYNKVFKTNQLNYNEVLMMPMTQLIYANPVENKTTEVLSYTAPHQFMSECALNWIKCGSN